MFHNYGKKPQRLTLGSKAVRVVAAWVIEHILSLSPDSHLDIDRSKIALRCHCHKHYHNDSNCQNDPYSKDMHHHGTWWHC